MFPKVDRGPIEYILKVRRMRVPQDNAECVRFEFLTTEEFQHFRYEISIEHNSIKRSLNFYLRGLKAKGLLPASGSASGTVDLPDLEGEYRVLVEKPGQIRNECSINVSQNRIILLSDFPQDSAFIRIET